MWEQVWEDGLSMNRGWLLDLATTAGAVCLAMSRALRRFLGPSGGMCSAGYEEGLASRNAREIGI